jgi:hypothetical protein
MPTSARPEDDGVRVESLPDAFAPVRDEIERMLVDCIIAMSAWLLDCPNVDFGESQGRRVGSPTLDAFSEPISVR